MSDDTRERMVRLEAEVEHMTDQVTDMQKKVNAMHDLLMQARGMRWMIVVLAAAGGFAADIAMKFVPFWR